MSAIVRGKGLELPEGIPEEAKPLLEKSRRNVGDFIQFADILTRSSKDVFVTKGVIDGVPQRELYRYLLERAEILARGGFLGERGTSSSSLVGCKGIGKTTALLNFVHLVPLFCPNVVPIFITCEENVSTGLAQTTFLQAVEHVLENELKMEFRNTKGFLELSTTRLVECLAANDKYLLLIIDELDILYQTDPDSYPCVTKSINELSGIGNLPHGRISCILSGSSSMLEHLIRTNILPGMKEEFAGLKGALNLNGTKFASRRISSSSPLDLEAVRSVTKTMRTSPDDDWVRMVAFTAGSNPREIHRVLDKTDPLDLLRMDADLNYSGQNTLKIPAIREFFLEINRKLISDNRELIQSLAEDVRKVVSIDLSSTFRPLTYVDCGQIWARRKEEAGHIDLNYAIFHLADRGWINAFKVENGSPKHIYPSSILKLVRFYLSSKKISEEKQVNYFTQVLNFLSGSAAVRSGFQKAAEAGAVATLSVISKKLGSAETSSKL